MTLAFPFERGTSAEIVYRAGEVDEFACGNLQIQLLEEYMFVAGDLDALEVQ